MQLHHSIHRILVVDDDESIRSLLVAQLQREGFGTVAANDGQDGLETFTETLPDIVLTDRMMPHMDGVEMAKRIREVRPSTILILMSGSDISNVPVGLFAAVLPKPFRMPALNTAIEEALRRRE